MKRLSSSLSSVKAGNWSAGNWSARNWSAGKWFAGIAAIVMVCAIAASWSATNASGTNATASPSPQFTLKPIPFSALHHSWQPPRIRNSNGTSLNWSGYAVLGAASAPVKPKKTAPAPTVSDVSGSWVVPSVVASASANTYSSSWVGIDGYSSGTVEQIGTAQDWANGAPLYYAWFEMYPKGAYEIVGFPVHPGDTISAAVEYLGAKGAFALTITNLTDSVTFSTTLRSQSARRLSAEWIQEAPWWGGVLPLANFGTIDFSDCYATMNGHTGTISDPAWQLDAITMVASDGVTVKAQPSDLSADGSSFSVTWYNE